MSIIKNSKFYGFNPSLLYALMAVHLVCLKGYSVVIDFSDAALTTPPAETYSGPGGGVFYNGADGAGGFCAVFVALALYLPGIHRRRLRYCPGGLSDHRLVANL